MQAMIFAAGFGKRLLPTTEKIPKALVKIRETPILDWNIKNLVYHGATEIIINTHYLSDIIKQHIRVSQYGVPITISHEPEILGTGQGFFNTRSFWKDPSFFVCNVDTLCGAIISEFKSYHDDSENVATLAVNHRKSDSMLIIDENGSLVGWKRGENRHIYRKPVGQPQFVGFAGWQVISNKIFGLIDAPVAFSIRDVYFNLIKADVKIGTWNIGDVYWEDIGTIETHERANAEFPGFGWENR